MKAIPGNPFAAEKMPNPEIEAAMMAKYGLDQPLWKQYIIYLGNFLRGDFGVSYTKAGLTVNKVIADGFPFSLTIGIYASLVVVFAGILFGSVCALRQNKLIDRFFMVLSTLGSTIPSFVLATGFLFLFSKTLGLVPAFGVDEVAGYIGPVLVIGAFPLSFITRLTRTSLVDTTACAPSVPIVAPKPFVMITNSPCALERMPRSVSLSTNSEPDMLKKSNATPYTIMESTNIHTPLPGLPMPKSPKRNTHASMAIMFQDEPEVLPFREAAAEHAGDILPAEPSGANRLACPPSSYIRIPHLLCHPDLLQEQPGPCAGQSGAGTGCHG